MAPKTGPTGQSHPGDFDVVIENIKQINFFKKRYQSVYPLLIWQLADLGTMSTKFLLLKNWLTS